MASQEEELFDSFKKVLDRMGSTFDDSVKTLDDYNKEVNKGRRSILTLGGVLQKLRESSEDMQESQERTKKQSEELLKQSRDTTKTAKERNQLEKEGNKLSKDAAAMQTKITAAQSAYQQTLREFKIGVWQKSMADMVVQGGAAAIKGQKDIYMAMINGLQAGQDGVRVASDIMLAQIRRNAAIAQGVAAGVAQAGQMLGGVTPGAAAAIELAGRAAGVAAGAVYQLSEDGINILSKELIQTRDTFVDLSKSGAIFAGGMTQMRNQLGLTGLTLGDYQTVLKNARADLQLFGTSQVDAMARVGAVTNTMGTEVNKQMRNMGYSNAEISEGVAEYMASVARTNTLTGKSQGDLARESADYLTNLKLISAITGEDAKSAQKRAQQAAMQSSIQSELATMGGDATAKFQNLVKVLPGLENEIMQIMKTGGTTNAAIANSPVFDIIKQAIAGVRDQSVSAEDVIVQTQNRLKEAGPAIQELVREMSAAGIGQLFGMDSPFAQALQGLTNLLPQTKRSGEEMAKALKDQKNTTDPLLRTTTDLQVATEKAAIALKDNLTGAVTSFAKDSAAVMANTKRVVEGELKTFIKVLETAATKTRSNNPGVTSAPTDDSSVGGLDVSQSYVAAASGAVLTGPTSGYRPNLTMHGTEAIVPLKDGGVPVNSPEMTELIQALKTSPTGAGINIAPLVEKMNENNQLLRSQVEMNRQIIDRLEAGNANTKGILSYAR